MAPILLCQMASLRLTWRVMEFLTLIQLDDDLKASVPMRQMTRRHYFCFGSRLVLSLSLACFGVDEVFRFLHTSWDIYFTHRVGHLFLRTGETMCCFFLSLTLYLCLFGLWLCLELPNTNKMLDGTHMYTEWDYLFCTWWNYCVTPQGILFCTPHGHIQ